MEFPRTQPVVNEKRLITSVWLDVMRKLVAGVTAGNSGAWVQISRQVLGSDQATVTFSSIPGTYNHLRLVVTGRDIQNAVTAVTTIQFNGTGGSLYDSQWLYGVDTTVAANHSAAQAFGVIGLLPGATSDSPNSRGQIEIFIPDYKDTTFEKTARSSVATAGARVTNLFAYTYVVSWISAAAISQIDLSATNKFKTGSIFTLYGIQ